MGLLSASCTSYLIGFTIGWAYTRRDLVRHIVGSLKVLLLLCYKELYDHSFRREIGPGIGVRKDLARFFLFLPDWIGFTIELVGDC
jgi:hypothetical protein